MTDGPRSVPGGPGPSRDRLRRLQRVEEVRDGYGLLLVMLIVDYFLFSISPITRWGGLIRGPAIALTVVFALYFSKARLLLCRLAIVGLVLSLVVSVLQGLRGSKPMDGALMLLLALLLALSPLTILRRIVRQPRVTADSLFGAVCVYVMLGLIFASAFFAYAQLSGHPFIAQSSQRLPNDYTYLSFVTLTTVGFGDVTAVAGFPRAILVFEAIAGQIFLVTMVARLVSMFGQETRRRTAPAAGDPAASGTDRAADDAGPSA